MSITNSNFGAAIPAGWSVQDAITDTQSARFATDNSAEYRDKLLLEDVISSGEWPVRNQGSRGTCNAFAFVAAEELYSLLSEPAIGHVPLSEEFLYGKSRTIPIPGTKSQQDKQAEARINRTGGTFLTQTLEAAVRFGLCAEHLVPYEQDIDITDYKENFSPAAQANAATRMLRREDFTHDITTNAQTGLQRTWKSGRNNLVSDRLNHHIQHNRPVVASFAILSDSEYAWTGELAQGTGEVRYPPDKLAVQRKAIAGHAVCLIGFVKNQAANSETLGWFIFRNSYGVHDFAYAQSTDKKPPIALAPGYGMISVDDADRYCWEYLARVAPSHNLPLK